MAYVQKIHLTRGKKYRDKWIGLAVLLFFFKRKYSIKKEKENKK
jgi:hypothetical protein